MFRVHREYPAGLVLEIFSYAIAEDVMNQAHAKQPGDEKGLKAVQDAIDSSMDAVSVPNTTGVTPQRLDSHAAEIEDFLAQMQLGAL